jgi:hypothetical protein
MNEKFEEIHLWTVYIIQLVITLIKFTKSDWYIYNSPRWIDIKVS